MPFQSVAGISKLLLFEHVADIMRDGQHADVADRHILAGNANFVFSCKVAAQLAKPACDVVAGLDVINKEWPDARMRCRAV
jgi:hypothetical protein